MKYTLSRLLIWPFLPVLFYQGKRVRSSVPVLPEAKGPRGIASPVKIDKNPLNLVTIGESTMAGVGVSTHEEGFSGSFANKLSNETNASVHWHVYARSGYTAHRVIKKIIPKIEEEVVDVIVIALGGNDAFTLTRPSKWYKDIIDIIKTLKQKYDGVDIVFANMPPIHAFPALPSLIQFFIGQHVEELGRRLKKAVTQFEGVYYYDRKITLEDWITRLNVNARPEDFFSDGVHPSKLTYQTWGRDLAAYYLDRKASLG